MYLLRILLLVPMILVTGTEDFDIPDNYAFKFTSDAKEEYTLKSIKVIESPSEKLNLSHLAISYITDHAFEHVSYIKILDLSNNLLSLHRNTLFANLTNLEDLNLSHNRINMISKHFAHLSNLKLLDLSSNHITKLNAGDFFGLTESCVILLQDNKISTMSTELFKNTSMISISAGDFNQQHQIRQVSVSSEPSIKICITGTQLISVEDYTEGEKLASGCSADRNHTHGFLCLNALKIVGFQKGWFKVRDSSIHHIDLSSNRITRLTSAIFNDLPASITSIDFALNRLEHLRKGIIVNTHLRQISFQNNLIVEIEDDVFINTRLTTLNLSFNELRKTKFAATLPPTLTKIELIWNSITEISRDSFSNLNQLEVLQLDGNVIKKIGRDSLRGLSSLKNLTLETNGLKKIEAGCFKDLTNLKVLRMKSNFINELESGVFSGLKNIKYIYLGRNRLSNLTRDSLIDLPDSLEVLELQFNALENLKTGDCNLPHLKYLNLKYNSLSVIDSGTFQGFERLCILDISENSIKELKNGSLHGLLQNEGCHVNL